MAKSPNNQAAVQANRAEQEMFVRHALLMLGFSTLPNTGIKGALMMVGPVGDLATMAGMEILANALTPRGTNRPPAGYTIVDGQVRVAAEVFDEQMRKNMAARAKGMTGEAIGMAGATALGLTGPVGAGVALVGNLAARSGVRALTPPNWLVRMFTPPGTNRPPLNMATLTREMVTFTNAKFSGDHGLILSGREINHIANSPSKDPSDLTIKFDEIWAHENTMPDPSQGPLHRIVKTLADYTDKLADPANALSYELRKEDENNPFYIPRPTESGKPPEPSIAWKAAADGLLGLCGIPDKTKADTNLLMEIDLDAIGTISEKRIHEAQADAKLAASQVYTGYDWNKMPDNQLVTIGIKDYRQATGFETETFTTRRIDGQVYYFGRDDKSYSAEDFAQQIIKPRTPYLYAIEVSESKIPLWGEPPKLPDAQKPAIADMDAPDAWGKAQRFKVRDLVSDFNTRPDAYYGRIQHFHNLQTRGHVGQIVSFGSLNAKGNDDTNPAHAVRYQLGEDRMFHQILPNGKLSGAGIGAAEMVEQNMPQNLINQKPFILQNGDVDRYRLDTLSQKPKDFMRNLDSSKIGRVIMIEPGKSDTNAAPVEYQLGKDFRWHQATRSADGNIWLNQTEAFTSEALLAKLSPGAHARYETQRQAGVDSLAFSAEHSVAGRATKPDSTIIAEPGLVLTHAPQRDSALTM